MKKIWSVNAFVSGAVGLRFKSLAGQLEYNAAARHRCYISSKGAVLPVRNDTEMGAAN